ncbi:MAG: hypothetical protein HY831_03900 [Candidatus Aenigmarchaeota archaeon]|nr:hypothetical protein [Candidatus Aenigmarchaeota archaeon]
MNNKDTLKELGLSEGEAAVYLALLKLGEAQVNRIKLETKIHRTTIYDFLDSLGKKGLVSYVLKNGVKFFRASHPSNLDNLLKEKKELLDTVLPGLSKMAELDSKPIKIEVYEGIEGMKMFFSRPLKEKEFLGLGIDETRFSEKFKYITESYIRKCVKLGIKERLITEKGTEFTYKYPHITYRYVEKKFFSPMPTAIFGDTTAFIVWEPLTIIFIENKEMANAYRKHFELIWRMADKSP